MLTAGAALWIGAVVVGVGALQRNSHPASRVEALAGPAVPQLHSRARDRRAASPARIAAVVPAPEPDYAI